MPQAARVRLFAQWSLIVCQPMGQVRIISKNLGESRSHVVDVLVPALCVSCPPVGLVGVGTEHGMEGLVHEGLPHSGLIRGYIDQDQVLVTQRDAIVACHVLRLQHAYLEDARSNEQLGRWSACGWPF